MTMVDTDQYKHTVYEIIGAAMEVHDVLKHGLLEAVYQEALSIELKNIGIECEIEKEIEIFYKHYKLQKKYRVDMLVGDIVVELKSVNEITSEHRAQLCNYLRLTQKPVGILINFGADSLYGERWGYDADTNCCFKLNKNMQPLIDLR